VLVSDLFKNLFRSLDGVVSDKVELE